MVISAVLKDCKALLERWKSESVPTSSTSPLASRHPPALPQTSVQPLSCSPFPENETLASFDLDITDEELPEFEERFELVLTIDSSTGDSDNGARLGSYASSLVTVAESDDPNGLFAISTLTSDVQVAEDVGEDGDGGSVEVIVERIFGDSGTVQVREELTSTSCMLTTCTT